MIDQVASSNGGHVPPFSRKNTVKRCPKCECILKPEDFSRDAKRVDGLRWACRTCTARDKAAYRSKNKSKILEASATYRKSAKVPEMQRQYRTANKERITFLLRSWAQRNKAKVAAYTAHRSAATIRATPRWADEHSISSAYEVAAVLSRSGVQFEVDHIVPLRGKSVCGLHTQDNLQVIPARQNRAKGNRSWPDMP